MPMLTENPLLLASLRRLRRNSLLLALLLVPFSLFLLAAPWWSSEGRNLTIAVTALGALCLAVSAYLVRATASNWRPERSPIMAILLHRAGEIVWVYEHRVDSQLSGVTLARTFLIRVQLADGKGFALPVAGNERDRMLELLAAVAPRATFGYSRDLARQYRRDPRSLASVTL